MSFVDFLDWLQWIFILAFIAIFFCAVWEFLDD